VKLCELQAIQNALSMMVGLLAGLEPYLPLVEREVSRFQAIGFVVDSANYRKRFELVRVLEETLRALRPLRELASKNRESIEVHDELAMHLFGCASKMTQIAATLMKESAKPCDK